MHGLGIYFWLMLGALAAPRWFQISCLKGQETIQLRSKSAEKAGWLGCGLCHAWLWSAITSKPLTWFSIFSQFSRFADRAAAVLHHGVLVCVKHLLISFCFSRFSWFAVLAAAVLHHGFLVCIKVAVPCWMCLFATVAPVVLKFDRLSYCCPPVLSEPGNWLKQIHSLHWPPWKRKT